MKITKRRVLYADKNGYVSIDIATARRDLASYELQSLGDKLADDAMRSIAAAPYVGAPLSRICAQRKRA